VGRELKVGQLQGVHYGYAHVSIPSGDGGKPHLAVIKVSRITSCELWEKE
jgi:hypothetical protein